MKQEDAQFIVQQFVTEYQIALAAQQKAIAAFTVAQEALGIANSLLGALNVIKSSMVLLPDIKTAIDALGVEIQ